LLTPDGVIQELMEIRRQSERGVDLLAEAERKMLAAELHAETIEAKALLDAQGTVVDRQSLAKLASTDAREAAQLARIEVNRIKTKLKHLTESQMAIQTAGRMIELTYKTAGVGER
jgi:hypothetical protein